MSAPVHAWFNVVHDGETSSMECPCGVVFAWAATDDPDASHRWMEEHREHVEPLLEHVAEDLRALARPIGEMTLDPKNARKHNATNHAAILAALRRHGQRKPIVARKGTSPLLVVAGNGTLAAARELGWRYIAVTVQAMDDPTAADYGIVDNRTAELAEWDEAMLTTVLRDLRDAEADMDGLGFTDKELEELLRGDDFAPTPDAGGRLDEQGPGGKPKDMIGCPKCGHRFQAGGS